MGEIEEHRSEWRKLTRVKDVLHMPGTENPADIVTKGKGKRDDVV